MPGCTAGKLLSFEHHDIGDATFGEMICDRAAFYATADDDDFGVIREFVF
jgi:hypothetical protein